VDCQRFLVVLRGLTGFPLRRKGNRHVIVRGANILAVWTQRFDPHSQLFLVVLYGLGKLSLVL
jgi:AMMECR1 domain-containing protein